MRIFSDLKINSVDNRHSNNTGIGADSDLMIFDLKFENKSRAFFSYFSDAKYLKLKSIVNDYDLSNKKNLSDIERFAVDYKNSFQKEYGYIKSASMELLLFDNPNSKRYQSLMSQINNMRKECRKHKSYVTELKKQVQFQKIGNCTDISAITKDDINKTISPYKGDYIYASIAKDDTLMNHVAVLVRDKKDKTEKHSKNSIVVDNWLGGVFKYSDWLKVMQKLYGSNEIHTYISEE